MSGPEINYFPEPQLLFAHGQLAQYPRDGLYLYGSVTPHSDLPTVRYGAIGTPAGIERLQRWCSTVSSYIEIPSPGPRSRAFEPQHVPFPGFSEAFGADWSRMPSNTISSVDPKDIERCLRIENRHEAIRETVSLYVDRLIKENNRLDNPPAFWFVVIPESIYELGRPQSVIPKAGPSKRQS